MTVNPPSSSRLFRRKRPLRGGFRITTTARRRRSQVFMMLAVLVAGVFYYVLVGFHQSNSNSSLLGKDTTTKATISQQHTATSTCRYNGNCPPNTSCEDGVCLSFLTSGDGDQEESIMIQNQERRQQHDKCVKSCLQELRMDEYYYNGMEPNVMRSYPHPRNDGGCVVQFQRIRVTNGKPSDIGTLDEWIDARFRRVVRVDVDQKSPSFLAVANENGAGKEKNPTQDKLLWNALCYLPCKSNSDCTATGTECIGRREQPIAAPVKIQTDPKSCQKSSSSALAQIKDMVVVTGADQKYYPALRNFAASLKYWAPERKLVVYNLGMSELAIEDIKKWTNVIDTKWISGIPQSLPPHVNDLHNYAWKSIIINETVHEYKSIFWLDSGASFTGPFDAIEEIVHRNGIFLVRGQDDDMKSLSHPSTYKALGYDKETFRADRKSPHFAGGIQGHVYPSRFVDSIVIPNAKCAMDSDCIAPKGSSLSNHRFDQTSLSILAYQSTVQAPHYTEYLAAGRDQLNSDLSQPSEKIMYTARGTLMFYSENVNLKDEEE